MDWTEDEYTQLPSKCHVLGDSIFVIATLKKVRNRHNLLIIKNITPAPTLNWQKSILNFIIPILGIIIPVMRTTQPSALSTLNLGIGAFIVFRFKRLMTTKNAGLAGLIRVFLMASIV